MASNRQIEANRINAKRSTGPNTDRGRAVSCKNALRHGLARSTSEEPADLLGCSNVVLALAGLGIESDELARTRHELICIRAARTALLGAFLVSMDGNIGKRLRGLDRFERAALRRQRRLLKRES